MVKSTASQRSQVTDAYGAGRRRPGDHPSRGRSGRHLRVDPAQSSDQDLSSTDCAVCPACSPECACTGLLVLVLLPPGRRADRPRTARRAVEVFGPVMTQLFGQAEAPFACTVLTREDIAAADLKHRGRLASCGRPTVAARVESMNDLGDLLGPGEQGEIVVRADLVFAGYWKYPEASTETRRPGGWHGTGDIGYRDVRVAVGASCGRVITLGITRLCRSPGRSRLRPADSPPPESAAICGASARRLPARPEHRNPPRSRTAASSRTRPSGKRQTADYPGSAAPGEGRRPVSRWDGSGF
ncbi:AMP-binding protein [Streptomyces sp. NPDC055036]